MNNIAVIGLGYVGLPVALAIAKKFPHTVGFDINKEKIAALNQGIDSTGEVSSDELKNTSYETAVGLVMKGIEKYERDSKRGANTVKQSIEPDEKTKAETPNEKENINIANHSQAKKGNFLSLFLDRAKDFMSDDV